jgi:hypothetical protein
VWGLEEPGSTIIVVVPHDEQPPDSSTPSDSPESHALQWLHVLQELHSWQRGRLNQLKQPKPDSPQPSRPPQLLHPVRPPTANAKTSRDRSFFILGISITNGILGRRAFGQATLPHAP